jgi:hypothetical protein
VTPTQIKLGMLMMRLFDRVKPANCYAIGANLFKSKGVNKVSSLNSNLKINVLVMYKYK